MDVLDQSTGQAATASRISSVMVTWQGTRRNGTEASRWAEHIGTMYVVIPAMMENTNRTISTS